MASRRMIDPSFWQSESIAELPLAVRYTFIGLFSNADDQGRLKAHPALLRSKIYPLDDIALDVISAHLVDLEEGDFIILYGADGRDYLQIKNWWRYQRPRWAWPSEYPAPDGWADRLRYRRGNTVIDQNWDDDEPGPNDDEGTPPDSGQGDTQESDPTAGSQWGHSEPAVESAPRDRTSDSTSDSDRPRTSDETRVSVKKKNPPPCGANLPDS